MCCLQVLGAEDITPEFRDNRIFLGGDVGLDTTFLLHPHGQLPVSERTSLPACCALSCTESFHSKMCLTL